VRLLFQIGLVSLGGAIGSLLRWGVGVVAVRWLGTAFPWGTFIINISGSLFLGWFMTVLAKHLKVTESAWLNSDDLRVMIAVGFTGAYTTFSTFEYEAHGLLRADPLNLKGLTYLFASVFLGLVAVRVGVYLAGGNADSQ
jgi:fluoride exporter